MKTECTYDVDLVDPAAAGAAYQKYFKRLEENGTYDLTLVFAPGTEDEHSITYKVPIREFVIPETAEFAIYFRDDKPVENLYTDRECTVPYTADTGTEDIELFAKDKSKNASTTH